VPCHQSETVHQQFGAVCGNSIFQSLLIHPISDMVNTRSSHLLCPPPSAPGESNDSELREFLKNMAESMEVLRKQNEELNTRLTVAEARSSQKERELAERRMRRKGRIEFTGESGLLILMKRIMKAQSRGIIVRSTMKSIVTSLVVWRPRMADHVGKGLDARIKESRCKRKEGEKSHRSSRHQDKSHHDESRHSLTDAKMKDLEDKYSRILRRDEWGRSETHGMGYARRREPPIR
jgi:hypothetical protein